MELRHLKYFLTVAEELHYRKAAERLFISQPGLSRQIKQLEELLGTPLFIRDKKKVTLTAAGTYLKKEAEIILAHLKRSSKQVKAIGDGKLGEVRIGFLGSAMQQVIPKMLLQLKDTFPEIHTSLEELSNRAQVNAILKDELDIGFVRLSRIPKGLRVRPVYEDTFSLVLPKDHRLGTDTFKGIHQLADSDFILFSKDYSPLYYDTVMSICEEEGFSPIISHKSVHAQTIFKLVENGLGVSIVPTALQYGFQLNVKFIELTNISQRAVLSVLWKDNHRNLALQHCLDLLFNEE
ncbi:LysR family transcriptional regulator [Croceitalea rosinachiae]|uniref:LysR family transcriptional regulator n=1 Tax=Croceitalea rosinachiae TaxID=3075596 RepID=A0ABU3A6L0_9FLAO|nr:LysR family transcriptional regulator [Croceitalea sp. F388]MDT0605815.1 LysR family transcriptional regulator [Croceitalea sp. F388]